MQKAIPPPEPRKAALAFIFSIVLLDVIALGIIIPVLPKLVESMLGGDTPRAAETLRPVRHRLGADAVRVLAAAGCPVGPLRPPPRAAHLDAGPRARLHPDGARPDARLAVRRPHHLRHHLGQLLDRLRLHRRHHAVREARRRVRAGGCRLRRRLRAGAGASADCWARSTRACRSGLPAAFCLANAACGYFLLPESLPLGAAHGVPVGARQPGRLAAPAAHASSADGTGGRSLPLPTWRTPCCRRSPSSTPATATAGATRSWG